MANIISTSAPKIRSCCSLTYALHYRAAARARSFIHLGSVDGVTSSIASADTRESITVHFWYFIHSETRTRTERARARLTLSNIQHTLYNIYMCVYVCLHINASHACRLQYLATVLLLVLRNLREIESHKGLACAITQHTKNNVMRGCCGTRNTTMEFQKSMGTLRARACGQICDRKNDTRKLFTQPSCTSSIHLTVCTLLSSSSSLLRRHTVTPRTCRGVKP